MQVVRSEVITLDKLREVLEENKGVLLWVCFYSPTYRILKGPYDAAGKKRTYSWFSVYLNRGTDRESMGASSPEELIEFIQERMLVGDQFYWFASEVDLVAWLRETAIVVKQN